MAQQFPPLPNHPGGSWGPPVIEAYNILRDGFQQTASMLQLAEADPLRLTILLDQTLGTHQEVLLRIGEEPGIPQSWVISCAHAMASHVTQLSTAIQSASGVDDANVVFDTHVELHHSGGRGRPRKVITKSAIRQAKAANPNATISQLAKEFGVHRHTLRKQMNLYGFRRGFDDIPDVELDGVVSSFRKARPLTGYPYTLGHIRDKGLKIQRWRLKASIARVEKLSAYLRKRKAIIRREYQVKRPHALWHLDGHHKLIRWGIVIHGIIDGFSRLVISLRACTNNESDTVEELFKKAAAAIGTYPSRLRADRGAENVKVAVLMILVRGLSRGSFIWGSSTHNTRIERLWLEVGRYLGHQWRAFFTRLERLHFMDVTKPHHLWLAHVLFLDDINKDCDEFIRTWNHKPISRNGKNMSPQEMVRAGHAAHGRYKQGVELDSDAADDCEGLAEDMIERRYGVFGRSRPRQEDGQRAGDSENEDELEGAARATAQRNVNHDAVNPPDARCPFPDVATAARFDSVWSQLRAVGFIPSGFGLLPEELALAPYPTHEEIRHGKGRAKKLNVPLALDPWKSRAELWATSLYALERFILENPTQ